MNTLIEIIQADVMVLDTSNLFGCLAQDTIL